MNTKYLRMCIVLSNTHLVIGIFPRYALVQLLEALASYDRRAE